MNIVDKFNRRNMRNDLPDLNPGDLIEVHQKIKEGDKERIQKFEGVVIAEKGKEVNTTITVRKRSFGVGVEKIFPLHSPIINDIKVLKRGKVGKSKLYYLRERKGKAAKIQEKEE